MKHMNTTKKTRSEKKAEQIAHKSRMDRLRAEVQSVVDTGICPCCGAKLRRNISLSGWWQCEQYGSEGFRKNSALPACSWQGFVS